MKRCKGCSKKIKQRSYCSSCRQKKWRENNPFKYHWKNKRNRAKQVGIPFKLTLEQFKKVWLQSGKWNEKLNSKGRCKYELDRIDGTKGYTVDNVQIITQHENLYKYNHFGDNLDYELLDVAPF